MSGRTVVVIPCFDEAERLDADQVLAVVGNGLHALLVDDGSTDGTIDLLRSIEVRAGTAVEVLALDGHVGKAEAVRRGMRRAAGGAGVTIVGFCDADFATPPDEVVRLASVVSRRPELVAVIGSRVDLLGHDVERPWSRTVGNRVYSAVASRLIGSRVRDTQCGAKFFRVGTPLAVALAEPFGDPWGFDAELLGRLLVGRSPAAPLASAEIAEVPLERWSHVAGSKLGRTAAAGALGDLVHLRRRLRRWQRSDPVTIDG